MNLNEARERAIKLMEENGLISEWPLAKPPLPEIRRMPMSWHQKNWTLDFDKARRRLGCAKINPKVITLSRAFVEANEWDKVRLTVLHEIAHALTPYHSHDAVWRRKCIEIGGDGSRTAANRGVVSPEHRYIGTCPNGHEANRMRIPKRKQSCGVCSPSFNEAYAITWSENPKYKK